MDMGMDMVMVMVMVMVMDISMVTFMAKDQQMPNQDMDIVDMATMDNMGTMDTTVITMDKLKNFS